MSSLGHPPSPPLPHTHILASIDKFDSICSIRFAGLILHGHFSLMGQETEDLSLTALAATRAQAVWLEGDGVKCSAAESSQAVDFSSCTCCIY